MRNRLRGLALGSVLLLGFGWSYAQSPQHEAHHAMQAGQQQAQMMQQQPMMMQHRQQMMSQMKATNQELETLLQKLEASKGDGAKLEVVQQMLAKIVESRTAMQQQMMAMMPQMMDHMSKNMSMQSGENSTMQCPMMSGQASGSGMQGPDDNSGSNPR